MSSATPEPTHHHSTHELLNTLRVARDTVRVQLDLLSTEARQRWQTLEGKLHALEVSLQRSEAPGGQNLESTTTRVRELAHAVKALMREGQTNAEVTTPIRMLIKSTPHICHPGDSLAQAAKLLWEGDCGALPVIDGESRVVGMVTDRDICMAAFTRGLPLHSMSVASAMSTEVHAAGPDDSLAHVARIMSKHQVRRVPVVEGGKLVGLISLADLAEHIHEAGQGGMPSSVVLMQALAGICERRDSASNTKAAA